MGYKSYSCYHGREFPAFPGGIGNDFLIKALPRKFSIGTGFLVCSKESIPPSNQTDIVIFDDLNNSPLHRELSSHIFPVEMVYAAIEVKGNLAHSDIDDAIKSIEKIRRLAKHKFYVDFSSPAGPPDKQIVNPVNRSAKISPRTYLFAYSSSKFKNLTTLTNYIRRKLKHSNAHLHGLIVLDKGWFLYQEPYTSDIKLIRFNKDALLRFVHKLTYDIQSMKILPVSLEKYFGVSYSTD